MILGVCEVMLDGCLLRKTKNRPNWN